MTISLVIPAFNEQDNIASCLDHALAQSPPFDEIIVVDNTSTDDTLVIAQRYAADHPGIRVIEERRRGVAFARRTGFDSAHGDIIGRVDADVRMSPGWTQSVSDSLSDGRWAAVTGVTMFYDAPAQDAFTAAFLWTMRIQGKGNGGPTPAIIGGSMGIRGDAWARVRDSVVAHDLPGTHEDQVISQALRDAGLTMYFNPSMHALTSPRRALIPPPKNLRSLATGIATAAKSGHYVDATLRTVAAPFNFLFLTILWLIIRPWDPIAEKWRPARLFTTSHDRASPIT